MRHLRHRHFFRRADVVDVQMLALLDHAHQPLGEVVDVDEGAGLVAGALDRKRDTVPVVSAKARRMRTANCGITCSSPMSGPYTLCGRNIDDAVEVLAAVVDRQQLADDLPAAVREPRIGDVGDDQRHVLRRRDGRGVWYTSELDATIRSRTPSARQASSTFIMPLTATSRISSGLS